MVGGFSLSRPFRERAGIPWMLRTPGPSLLFPFRIAFGRHIRQRQGPLREYTAFLPGDPQGGYQTELQRNAETVLEISQGEDIAPEIDGTYTIVNAASHLAVGGENGTTANMTNIVQSAYVAHPSQQWDVTPVPMTQGGDFSYFFIKNSSDGQALDNCNWNLEPGGKVIAYGASDAAVQQWALEYDGDGFFHIRNKHSALYLEPSGEPTERSSCRILAATLRRRNGVSSRKEKAWNFETSTRPPD